MSSVKSKNPGAMLRRVESAGENRGRQAKGPWAASYARPSFDWSDVDPATVTDGLNAALETGYAVTVSLTADGGAVKLTLWANNQKYVAYAGDADTLNDLFAALVSPKDGTGEQAAD